MKNNEEPIIQVKHLSKEYKIGIDTTYKTLSESITDTLRSPLSVLKNFNKQNESYWALKDVNFEVNRGEVVGIIGRNGAGKSTLLKVLSRITHPTEGEIILRGRVGSLLEVGTGFHPELTGRENVYFNGAILGMKKREIEDKFEDIVKFSGVEKFLDTPVKRYSSGMYVRLAFAVAAHMDPEILIVDEVLAVGDAAFQKKCLGKMGEVAEGGRTVLFVSHNMGAVENLCNRAVVLDQGIIRFTGTQTAAISEYQRSFSTKQTSLRHRTDRKGTGEVRVLGIEFRDVEGHTIDSVACGQDFDVVFHFKTLPGFSSSKVLAGFSVSTATGIPVFLHHNRMVGSEFGNLPHEGSFVCRIRKLPLVPSTYTIGYSIMLGSDYLDNLSDAVEIDVMTGTFFGTSEVPPSSHGFCLVDGQWSLEGRKMYE